MKKILASVITLILLLSCCLIAAFPTSAADVNYDDFEIVDGLLVEYLGSDSEVVVPSVDRDGNPVTAIDNKAFWGNTDITSVVISEGIETMGAQVFEECTNLSEVSLPYSLKEAAHSVFRKTALMSIVVPAQLATVPPSFASATGGALSDIVISPGVEVISADSFSAVSEIIFPESVYQVYAFAFTYLHQDMSLYFCNPDVELGTPAHKAWSETEVGPIVWARSGATPEIKFYSLKDSGVAEYVKEHQKGYINTLTDKTPFYAAARFVPISQEKLDEKQAECQKRGITSAPEKDGKDDKDANGNTDWANGAGNNNNNAGNNNNNAGNNQNVNNNSGNNSTLIIIIIAVAAFFLIMMIMVVVIVLIMMNKKKKKKKKKSKAEAAPVDETKTEEAAELPAEEATEAIAEEEKGEEE